MKRGCVGIIIWGRLALRWCLWRWFWSNLIWVRQLWLWHRVYLWYFLRVCLGKRCWYRRLVFWFRCLYCGNLVCTIIKKPVYSCCLIQPKTVWEQVTILFNHKLRLARVAFGVKAGWMARKRIWTISLNPQPILFLRCMVKSLVWLVIFYWLFCICWFWYAAYSLHLTHKPCTAVLWQVR